MLRKKFEDIGEFGAVVLVEKFGRVEGEVKVFLVKVKGVECHEVDSGHLIRH